MEDVVGYTDAFVICSGQNPRHVQAIAEEVELVLKHDEGLLPKGGEGRRDGDWILLDFLDCVLHVFTPEARDVLPPRAAVGPGPAAPGRLTGTRRAPW